MPVQRFDMGSKWLLHNQGKGVLLVGGFKDVRRIEPMPGEIVQSRRYPDGLLRVYLAGERKPHHVLIEVATYPEERALQQALDDLTLAYQTLRHLPELLMLVLRPKGRFRISGHHEVRSKLGLSRLEVHWRPVELWTLSAEEFLAAGEVGVTPWVPLMHFDGQPEELLERCAEKIKSGAHPADRAELLAVSQILGELVFPLPLLAKMFGGEKTMFESRLLQKLLADRLQKVIVKILEARFGSVPPDISRRLLRILNDENVTTLSVLAAQCPDLETFREGLSSK